MATVYVHFPWCLAKCPYCDFVSYATDRASIDHVGYADALLRELDARTEAASLNGPARTITSVFFGGGTPSLWDPKELGRVLAAIRGRWPTATDVEVTVECNPTSLDGERAHALAAAGATRLSIGTQSLRSEQLTFLGRLHDPAGARAAVTAALATGLRVSTDLIFGLPGQSVADARDQARTLAASGLAHLSCYQLTIEPNTQFGERKKRGLLPMADEGVVADAFLAIEDELAGAGLAHYEISNYAAPGQEARHNLAYWRGDEYLGLGCGAFGFFRYGTSPETAIRYRNEIDPAKYVAKSRSVASDRIGDGDGLTISHEALDAEALLRERIMLGLRLAEGFDLAGAGEDLGVDPWPRERRAAASALTERGRLAEHDGRLSIPRGAWLFADDTASRLF